MARNPRIQYPGAAYHVFCRGDRREPIFIDDNDRKMFLKCLADVCEKTGWRIHAYVLMPNHYHLLVETPNPNLVDGMRWFQTTYTARFNARHRLNGHLFQGRYKAIVVETEARGYFLGVSNYIHLNPVRGGLVKGNESLVDFQWSSYPGYVRHPTQHPIWLYVERVLDEFGEKDNLHGRSTYRRYLEREADEERNNSSKGSRWKAYRRGWYMGGTEFRDKLFGLMESVMKGRQRSSYVGEAIWAHKEKEAETLIREALKMLKIDDSDMVRWKKGDEHKQAIAWLVKKHTTVRNRWLSERLRMGHEVTVSKAVRRIAEDHCPAICRLRVKLEKLLKC
ncbi:MAG: transposase [Kiritimatiellia bacterium]|nr:transposase [Kiritimatiellia bacterium]